MMDKMDLVTFQDLFATPLRNGLTRPKSVRGQGTKMVNMGEIFAYSRIGNIDMDRVHLSEKEVLDYLLEPDDLLFARQSLVLSGAGKCSIILKQKEPVTFESHIIRARLNKNLANPMFYYYFFISAMGRQLIETIVEQVAAAGIRGSDLARLRVPYLPLSEQQAIATILGSLDNKIELNRQTNETLEAMASAIFKSWFVDFDPVRAKMEGRVPQWMDKETADLFPNSFEISKFGGIPKGWRVGLLGDVADNPRRGVTPNEINQSTPYIGLEHMPRKSIALGEWGLAQDVTSNKYRFYQGEILFGKLRPYFHKVGVAIQDGVCSTDILVIVPKNPEWFSFVMEHVTSDEFVQYTDSTTTGTKMPRTNWRDMKAYKVILPPKNIVDVFNKTVNSLVSAIRSNILQTHTLISIRDTLLPKLLSGEIRVKEEEKLVETHL